MKHTFEISNIFLRNTETASIQNSVFTGNIVKIEADQRQPFKSLKGPVTKISKFANPHYIIARIDEYGVLFSDPPLRLGEVQKYPPNPHFCWNPNPHAFFWKPVRAWTQSTWKITLVSKKLLLILKKFFLAINVKKRQKRTTEFEKMKNNGATNFIMLDLISSNIFSIQIGEKLIEFWSELVDPQDFLAFVFVFGGKYDVPRETLFRTFHTLKFTHKTNKTSFLSHSCFSFGPVLSQPQWLSGSALDG